MPSPSSALVPVAVLAVGAAACAWYWTRDDSDDDFVPIAEPTFGSRVRPNPSQVGLAMDRHGVYVADWGEWMEFAPEAFERAIADGRIGAENVLLHVLQRALPREQWPPPEGTQQSAQYRDLVKVVAEWLTLEPEPGPHLRVVRSS